MRLRPALLSLLLLPALGCPALGINVCANNLRERYSSPDGQHEAVVYDRDCGVGVPISTHVAVLPIYSSFADDMVGNAFAAQGQVVVGVSWDSPTDLRLRVPAGANVQIRDTVALAVRVHFDGPGADIMPPDTVVAAR